MNLTIISSSIREGRQSDQVAYAIESRAKIIGIDNIVLIDLGELSIPHMSNSFNDLPKPGNDLSQVNKKLKDADFLIFVSPEYNGSYTAQLKNAVDFFPKSHFEGKPIGICSVSAGDIGGMRGAIQLQQLVLALWAYPIPNMLLVSNVSKKFNEKRELVDMNFKKSIDEYLEKLCWFTQAILDKKNA